MIDIFAIARGLNAGQQAYKQGQKEEANRIWTDIKNNLEVMTTAQNIRQSAELHPLEMQLKETEVPYRQALTRQAKAGAETEEQKLADLKNLRTQLEARTSRTWTDFEVQAMIDSEKLKSAQTKLGIRTAEEQLPYIQPNLKLEYETNRVKYQTALKNLDLIESEIKKNEASGKDNSLQWQKYIDALEEKRQASEALKRFAPNLSLADVEVVKDLQDIGVIKTDADRMAEEAHQQAMLSDQRTAESKVDGWIRDMNDTIYSIQSGNPINAAIAEKILGRPVDSNSLNNDGLKQLVLESIGSQIKGYAMAFPSSAIIQNSLNNYEETSRQYLNQPTGKYIPSRKVKITPPPPATTTFPVPSANPERTERLRKILEE